MTRCRFLPAVGFALTLAAASGCGYGSNDRVPVEGAVSYKGEAVDSGTITFVPEDSSKPRTSAEVKDGKYTIPADKGPIPGKYRVEVTWNKKTGKQVPAPGDPGHQIDQTVQVIPADYNKQTSLTAEVKPERNKIDFTLPK